MDWLAGLILPAGIVLVFLAGGVLLRKALYRRLFAWAEKTEWKGDEAIIQSTERPFLLLSMMVGIYVALEASLLPQSVVDIAGRVLLALGVAAVTLVADDIASNLVSRYSRGEKAVLPATSLTRNIIRALIWGLGVLILLHSLGISIAPLLTALGIGGLAVALALQDTLSNLFSGFYVALNKQVRIGDYMKLESGEEGYVTDMNWRTTTIRNLPNNIIVVPNTKLATAIVTNYDLIQNEMAVLVQVGVDYDSDLKNVERVTVEVGSDVMRTVSGGVPEFEPFIRYHTFNDSSIDFTVILRAKKFVDQYLVKHEFIKRLHERYNREGIVIPFPIRTIYRGEEGE